MLKRNGASRKSNLQLNNIIADERVSTRQAEKGIE
jgi:hypothetical protein